jgi:ribose 5-phosphate isomerase B
MIIYLATDHAGYELKEKIKSYLLDGGYRVKDFGANVLDPEDDYPDFVHLAAKAVSKKPRESLGIILGGSGEGEAMVANRYRNVRATVYYGREKDIIRLSREHNNANILSLGARFLSEKEAISAVSLWLKIPFPKKVRHERRNGKIDKKV